MAHTHAFGNVCSSDVAGVVVVSAHMIDSKHADAICRVMSDKASLGRAFLAKGLVLKDVNRKGDAQRMFLQARQASHSPSKTSAHVLLLSHEEFAGRSGRRYACC